MIEDSIIEQPDPSPAREITSCVMSSGILSTAVPPQKLHLQPLGMVIRNCYFNFDFINPRNGPLIPVTSVVYTSGSATVEIHTLYPHNVNAGPKSKDCVEIQGATNSAYNGRFPVTDPADDDPTSRILKVDLGADPGSGTGGAMTVQQSFQPTLPIVSLTFDSGTNRATVTTPARHWRKVDDWVVVSPTTGVDLGP